MKHPDKNELMRSAAGEATDAQLAGHVASCPACAAEVERLRTGVGGILATATLLLEPGPQCLDDQAVAALADGHLPSVARDAMLTHLATCARCRAAVSSVAQALGVEGIARELAPLELAAPARWRRYAVATGAAAAVAALVLVTRPPVPVLAPVHRDPSVATGPAPVTISPTGPTRSVAVLRWHSVRGADRYRVTLFNADGAVLYETALSDTVAELPENIEIEVGRAYYWMVAARTAFDRWDTSTLAAFSVDGAGR